jgi:hypothetical protein
MRLHLPHNFSIDLVTLAAACFLVFGFAGAIAALLVRWPGDEATAARFLIAGAGALNFGFGAPFISEAFAG